MLYCAVCDVDEDKMTAADGGDVVLSDDDNDDSSSDEVDVVSLSHTMSSHSSQPVSVVRELLVLPRTCSLLARVTAMHNYSSCTSQYTPPAAAPAADSCVYSAPQSPSSMSTDRLPLRQRADRGCISTPASPSRQSSTESTTTTTVGRSRRRRRRSGRARQRPSEWSGSDESDSAGSSAGHPVAGGKRAHHNVLERRRRDDLRWSFEALRAVVPGGAADVRVPKVAILRHARDYVRQLTNTWDRLNAEYSRLKAAHQQWTYKLSLLSDNQLTSSWLRRSEH